VTVDVTFETDKGEKSGRYTGVLLWSLIEKAGLTDVSATKRDAKAHAADYGTRWLRCCACRR
jgi:hypothetical protein